MKVGGGSFALGIKALNIPTTITIDCEFKAVMKAMFAISPEFYFLWIDRKATPMWRACYSIRKTGFNSTHLGGKIIAAGKGA